MPQPTTIRLEEEDKDFIRKLVGEEVFNDAIKKLAQVLRKAKETNSELTIEVGSEKMEVLRGLREYHCLAYEESVTDLSEISEFKCIKNPNLDCPLRKSYPLDTLTEKEKPFFSCPLYEHPEWRKLFARDTTQT